MEPTPQQREDATLMLRVVHMFQELEEAKDPREKEIHDVMLAAIDPNEKDRIQDAPIKAVIDYVDNRYPELYDMLQPPSAD